MDSRIITAIITVIAVPVVLVGYILLTERVIGLLPERRQPTIRPWLWIAPAVALVTSFLVLPTIATIGASLFNKTGKNFIGTANYEYFFSSDQTLVALRNSIIWVVLLTAA